MFDNIVDWFLGRPVDRRQHKRRTGAFHLWWQPDPANPKNLKQGIGLDISAGGVSFILPEAIPQAEFTLILRLREQNIPVRTKRLRVDEVQHQGKTWHRYNVEFSGISADHWDRIVRYVDDAPEPENKAKKEIDEKAQQSDDAYRLLPMAIQQRIIAMLVEKNRLDAPKPHQTPLMKLFYGGQFVHNGKKAHRFNVHSRAQGKDEMIAYDTRFIVTEDGIVTIA